MSTAPDSKGNTPDHLKKLKDSIASEGGVVITGYFALEILAKLMKAMGFESIGSFFEKLSYAMFIVLLVIVLWPSVLQRLPSLLKSWRIAFGTLGAALILVPVMPSEANQETQTEKAIGALLELANLTRDPRVQLNARGYKPDTDGLSKAITQQDKQAVKWFAQANVRVDGVGPLFSLLDEDWNPEIAGLLTREMFSSPRACELSGGLATWSMTKIYAGWVTSETPEKAETFLRLCQSKSELQSLQRHLTRKLEEPQAVADENQRKRIQRALEMIAKAG